MKFLPAFLAILSAFLLTQASAVNCNVNGCTKEAAVECNEVYFPTDDGFALAPCYYPACVRLEVGDKLRFQRIFIATFEDHPLRGGEYFEYSGYVNWTTDPSNPFCDVFDDPDSYHDVTFTKPGVYPFVATDAVYIGMMGAVYVGEVECTPQLPVDPYIPSYPHYPDDPNYPTPSPSDEDPIAEPPFGTTDPSGPSDPSSPAATPVDASDPSSPAETPVDASDPSSPVEGPSTNVTITVNSAFSLSTSLAVVFIASLAFILA